ncbi:unnamed protein product [Kluyveromyces dobzhanskii CBS 2104]|uniref:Transcriptional protein SWT1 n=1 Tax=Kluyveromyces dobzhanskii CBS 2104 TaxID=1427455 RepID=A0A0A8LBN9_9SACH|nr:unnamed protein product [Kluyveromyces dobzhanskii CBS 2104]
MLNSKYASTKSDEVKPSGNSSQNERSQKYGLHDLHKQLGLDQPDVEQPISTKYDRLASTDEDRNHDEDMMDLDDENEVSFVSDLTIDHRKHHHYEDNNFMNLDYTSSNQLPASDIPSKKIVLVVDTNFIISHLNTLEQLRLLSIQYNHLILIPTTVIQELDGLKNSNKSTTMEGSTNNTQSLGKLSRAANDWIYKHLANLESAVMVQRLTQRNSYNLEKDDAILDCCLYFSKKLYNFVVLLSNDKNLCLRAITEQILTVSYRKGMSAELIASRVYDESLARNIQDSNHPCQPCQPLNDPFSSGQGISNVSLHNENLRNLAFKAYNEFLTVTTEAVHLTMINSYGDDLSFTSYDKNQINDFISLGVVVYNHYMSVFSEFFNRTALKRSDWKHLPQELTSIPEDPIQLNSFVTFWSKIIEQLHTDKTNDEWRLIETFTNNWLANCSAFKDTA